MMLEETIAQLLRHYGEELAHYREIHALAAMQQQLCARGELSKAAGRRKFDGLLSRRRQEIALIADKVQGREKIEVSLAQHLGLTSPHAAFLAASLHAAAPCAPALRLTALLQQLTALLQQISALDRQSAQHLRAAREQLELEMERLRGWKRAKGAYRPAGRQKEGYFVEQNR